MPKNWVVTIRPASPYAAGSPQSSGRGSKAPRGCLSNPTARATSAAPDRIACTADISALPPVAQPFLTFVKGIPVRPRSETSVSARPDPSLPPKATWTSVHSSPASRSAAWMAWRPSSRPVSSGCRPNLDRPIPTIGHAGARPGVHRTGSVANLGTGSAATSVTSASPSSSEKSVQSRTASTLTPSGSST